jgi:diadenosine tetraphosphatase ApaH/serine/threonine PP2A family protein phosphatase
MKGRVIAVGDIHGCAWEFEQLVERLALTRHDRLILLGDLINRGPESARVISLARTHAHRSLLGNHELRLLNYRRTGDPTHLKKSDYETLRQLSAEDWAYLEAMPSTYHVEEADTVLVHGGFLPGRTWRRQPVRVVTRIQVVGPDGEPRKRSEFPDAPHWSELWQGPPFVIYGHTPRSDPERSRWTLGIDTSCVLGGALSVTTRHKGAQAVTRMRSISLPRSSIWRRRTCSRSTSNTVRECRSDMMISGAVSTRGKESGE